MTCVIKSTDDACNLDYQLALSVAAYNDDESLTSCKQRTFSTSRSSRDVSSPSCSSCAANFAGPALQLPQKKLDDWMDCRTTDASPRSVRSLGELCDEPEEEPVIEEAPKDEPVRKSWAELAESDTDQSDDEAEVWNSVIGDEAAAAAETTTPTIRMVNAGAKKKWADISDSEDEYMPATRPDVRESEEEPMPPTPCKAAEAPESKPTRTSRASRRTRAARAAAAAAEEHATAAEEDASWKSVTGKRGSAASAVEPQGQCPTAWEHSNRGGKGGEGAGKGAYKGSGKGSGKSTGKGYLERPDNIAKSQEDKTWNKGPANAWDRDTNRNSSKGGGNDNKYAESNKGAGKGYHHTETNKGSGKGNKGGGKDAGKGKAGGKGKASGKGSRQEAEDKYICQIIIGIEEDNKFRAVRRIFGSGGENMKNINQQTGAKLRLRGRGSKFLEGEDQVESTDDLMLCVSALTKEQYDCAKGMASELIEGIHRSYRAFCRKTGKECPNLELQILEGKREGGR